MTKSVETTVNADVMTMPTDYASWVSRSDIKTVSEQTVKYALTLGADEVEVGVSVSMGIDVTARDGDIENLEFTNDQGFGITVYKNQCKGSVSVTDISQPALEAAVERALKIAQYSEPDDCHGIPDEKDLVKAPIDCQLYQPDGLSIDAIKQVAIEAEKASILKEADVPLSSDGSQCSATQSYAHIANSKGLNTGYGVSRFEVVSAVIAGTGEHMEQDYAYAVGLNQQAVEAAAAVGARARTRALRRLNPRSVKTGQYKVLIDSDITGGFWGTLLRGISGGMIWRERSFLCDHLGKQLFNSSVNLIETPHILGQLGALPYDDEGVETREKPIIQNGKLETYLIGSYASRKLKIPVTGNAGGISRLSVMPTMTGGLQPMLEALGTGIWVTDLMGQGVNIQTGDYSKGAFGFWVEQGKVQYPIHEFTIAGQLKSLYEQLSAIGDDFNPYSDIHSGSILLEQVVVGGA